MSKEQEPPQERTKIFNKSVLWKQDSVHHCWAETKAMVDAGYKAFFERRGMTPPNELRRSWFERGK
jgi:hypothetical protein